MSYTELRRADRICIWIGLGLLPDRYQAVDAADALIAGESPATNLVLARAWALGQPRWWYQGWYRRWRPPRWAYLRPQRFHGGDEYGRDTTVWHIPLVGFLTTASRLCLCDECDQIRTVTWAIHQDIDERTTPR